MEKNEFVPEINEEIFDIVDSALEEELEKYDIPKRLKYELMMAINKNMEKKFENTRVEVTHIMGPIGPVKKETASLAKAKPENLVNAGGPIKGVVSGEKRVFGAKEMLERRQKVENATRMNEDIQPVGYKPQPELAEDMTNQFGFDNTYSINNSTSIKEEDTVKFDFDDNNYTVKSDLPDFSEFEDNTYSIGTSTPTKVENEARFNNNPNSVGFNPEVEKMQNDLNESTNRLSSQIEELRQLKTDLSATPNQLYDQGKKY